MRKPRHRNFKRALISMHNRVYALDEEGKVKYIKATSELLNFLAKSIAKARAQQNNDEVD